MWVLEEETRIKGETDSNTTGDYFLAFNLLKRSHSLTLWIKQTGCNEFIREM